MLNILTVCTGNICRSPLVEYFLTQELADLAVTVASAGTRARDGMTMPRAAVDTATDMGIIAPLDGQHRARLLRATHLADVHLALPLAREHRREIVELSPALTRRTFTVREFSRLAEGLSDADFVDGAPAMSGEPQPSEMLNHFISVLTAQRGVVEPPKSPLDDDVVDPFGRSADVYAETAGELERSLPAVIRLVRLAFKTASPDGRTDHRYSNVT